MFCQRQRRFKEIVHTSLMLYLTAHTPTLSVLSLHPMYYTK